MNIRTTVISIILSLSIACTAIPGIASAAGYLKLDGIDGESKDADHDKWIDILSVSESISYSSADAATGSTRQRGRAVLEDIQVQKEVDRTSPTLRHRLATGAVIPKVEIELTRHFGGRNGTYFKYELTNVLITSVSLSGSTQGDTVPEESLSLNFERIKWTYTEFDPQTGDKRGDVEEQYNVETGQ